VNPSGGLLWHWRAWRSQQRWGQTRQEIAQWLGAVAPRADELLLVGASAGWMLPGTWLQQFKQVHAWDIDPLAPTLFRWRHARALASSGTLLRWHRADALASLGATLRQHPKACILFDNLLGQLCFHCHDEDQTAGRLAEIVKAMATREWGSLHDAYSGPVRAPCPAQPAMQQRPAGEDQAANRAWLALMGAQGHWLDHRTASLFPDGTPVQHMAWPYQPGYWHWLQAGWVKPRV